MFEVVQSKATSFSQNGRKRDSEAKSVAAIKLEEPYGGRCCVKISEKPISEGNLNTSN